MRTLWLFLISLNWHDSYMKGSKGVRGLSIHKQAKKFRTFPMFDNIIARPCCWPTVKQLAIFGKLLNNNKISF